MNYNSALNLIEEISEKDIYGFIDEFKKLTKKELPKNLKVEIRKNLGDPASSYSGDNGQKADPKWGIKEIPPNPPKIIIDSNIKNKEVAKRLTYHELVHLITPEYEEGEIKINGKMTDSDHIGNFTRTAKKINKKLGGGEYIPIRAEDKKWVNWIKKNEPEFNGN